MKTCQKIFCVLGNIFTPLAVFLQPITRHLFNCWDYYWYTIRYSFTFHLFLKTFLTLTSIIATSYTFYQYSNTSKINIEICFTAITVIITIFLYGYDYIRNLDGKYVQKTKEENAYKDVEPPLHPSHAPSNCDKWEKRIIRIKKGNKIIEEASIYYNNSINQWLKDEAWKTKIVRDTRYEKDLKRKIRDRFKKLYRPFLRHNYRASKLHGRQFTNEKKMGHIRRFLSWRFVRLRTQNMLF